MKNEIVIDAEGCVLGRIASYSAKQALVGNKIFVINCNKALVIGKRDIILENYKTKRFRGGSSLKGPHFPKSPEKIMKRTIRGMLSYKKGRGGNALKDIRCYNEAPIELESAEKINLKKDLKFSTMTLKEISREL